MEEIIINTKPRNESNLISQEIHTLVTPTH